MNQTKMIIRPNILIGLLTVIVLVITAQSNFKPLKKNETTGFSYTGYNNYIIFKQSFFHLIEKKDLYQLYPSEHWDYYKYSPSFALWMAPMAVLPDFAGLFIWNFLNAFLLLFAFCQIPLISGRKKLFLIAFFLIELITSLQNSQSNGLMAAFIILAFIMMEKRKVGLAALLIVLSIGIKLFGIVALSLFLFYPQKAKAVFYVLGWIVITGILPLAIISPEQLLFLYKSWWNLLQNDHSVSMGLSVGGWLNAWFGLSLKNSTVLAGILFFCLPLLHFRHYSDFRYRVYYLASVLIWVVIFNHKAESPTFIIATAGIAIWYAFTQKNRVTFLLLLLTFVFTALSPTDVFPPSVRKEWLLPYVVKVVPCILTWMYLTYELLFFKASGNEESSSLLSGS